jgi:hypothetical protein
MKELNKDLLAEETQQIKDWLFEFFWKQISHGVCAGFADYYKKMLMDATSEPTAYQYFLATKDKTKTENQNEQA